MLVFQYVEKGVRVSHEIAEYNGKTDTPEEIRNAVNEEWVALQNNQNVDYTTLRGIITIAGEHPVVMLPPKDRPMTWGIWGQFTENGKLYPFEADAQLEEGDAFIAMPNGVPAIAIVKKCVWTERAKVVSACKGHKLFKIVYKAIKIKKEVRT